MHHPETIVDDGALSRRSSPVAPLAAQSAAFVRHQNAAAEPALASFRNCRIYISFLSTVEAQMSGRFEILMESFAITRPDADQADFW